jgi:hypothetical protein
MPLQTLLLEGRGTQRRRRREWARLVSRGAMSWARAPGAWVERHRSSDCTATRRDASCRIEAVMDGPRPRATAARAPEQHLNQLSDQLSSSRSLPPWRAQVSSSHHGVGLQSPASASEWCHREWHPTAESARDTTVTAVAWNPTASSSSADRTRGECEAMTLSQTTGGGTRAIVCASDHTHVDATVEWLRGRLTSAAHSRVGKVTVVQQARSLLV